jgi:ribonuclease BN (tRNA processing enzyme)
VAEVHLSHATVQALSWMSLGTALSGVSDHLPTTPCSTNPLYGTVVDCAEGTTRQLELQPYYDARRYRRGRLTNIFITHMHGMSSPLMFNMPHASSLFLSNYILTTLKADHTMGLIGLLKNILAFPKPNTIPVIIPLYLLTHHSRMFS